MERFLRRLTTKGRCFTMEFTGNDIKVAAELYTGASLEPEEVILIINEALDTIGDLALHDTEVSVVAEEKNKWCNLPEDTTAILCVSDKAGQNYNGWTTNGTKIKFEDVGEYLVGMRRMVPKISTLDDKIVIHPLFRKAILAYTRGFIKLMDDDQSSDGMAQMQEFVNVVGVANKTLKDIRKLS